MTTEELLKKIEEAAASKATALDLSGGELTALPPELFQLTNLTTLDLSGNQLTTLPPDICQLTNLTTLTLDSNPLVSPPVEITNKGIEAIRQYFAELEKGTQPLNEVKLILVGDGAAGKTSLVKRLFGQPFDERENVTHGINIHGWEQEVGGQKIKINIWDFGGQEIMHATHQFFLSKRSLYVLVLDGRKDEHIEYWLRHIESFGGDSPVLIVLNKMDSNPSCDVNRPFLREKYQSIRGFFRTSCMTGEGIAQFKEALLNEAAKMEMTSIRWPKSWLAVKSKLELMDRPYINDEQYKTICKETGIFAEQSRETLLDFLHDLGIAVHFSDFILDDMHVLDPAWITNAVYKIITSEEAAENRGILNFGSLRNILRQRKDEGDSYLPHTYTYILALMQKFELCYELSKDSVIIPQLLPVPEPEFTFEKDGSLRFALHYPDFLPPSVFPRFMVKVHKDIKGDLRWKTGVVLVDMVSGNEAVAKADYEVRRINVWVQGKHRREYLHYIRYLFADINSSFEKLHVRELVPMPDAEDITADYVTLLEYARNDIDKYIPTGASKVYSVRELLGLVQPKDADELVRLANKATPQDTITWTEMITDLIEPKWTIPIMGITFNLKGFFEKLLEYQKQKRQQSRK